MDRRKRTGVALAAGLLFLFVTEYCCCFWQEIVYTRKSRGN